MLVMFRAHSHCCCPRRTECECRQRDEDAAEEQRLAREQALLRQQFEAEQAKQRVKQAAVAAQARR